MLLSPLSAASSAGFADLAESSEASLDMCCSGILTTPLPTSVIMHASDYHPVHIAFDITYGDTGAGVANKLAHWQALLESPEAFSEQEGSLRSTWIR